MEKESEGKTVKVISAGSATVKPDRVEVIYQFQGTFDEFKEAKKKYTALIEEIRDEMKKAGMDLKDETDQSISTDFSWADDPKSRTQCEIQENLRFPYQKDLIFKALTLRRVKGIGETVNLRFFCSEELTAQGMKNALQNAVRTNRAEADALAEALEMKIKGIRSFLREEKDPESDTPNSHKDRSSYTLRLCEEGSFFSEDLLTPENLFQTNVTMVWDLE
jgi:uncharacterized protein YggE